MNIVVTESLRQAAQVQTRAASAVGPQVSEAARRLAECLQADRRVYVIGNGGSAADAQHFAAEFTGKYLRPRLPLPVLALTTDTSALTCIGNDYGYDAVFSRQVEAFARPGDILFAISTSGNSVNVIEAARSARRKGVSVIGMTGRAAAGLDAFCDLVLKVPSPVTARVQECQMTILHIICDLTERILLDSRRPAPKTRVCFRPRCCRCGRNGGVRASPWSLPTAASMCCTPVTSTRSTGPPPWATCSWCC